MASKRGFGVGFLLLSSLFVVIWGLLAGLKVLWAIIKHPVESFKKSVRDVAPACLTDLSLGSHEYVHANGLKFHCVRSGERSKPLMLLLHGFPEFWYSWRYQIPEFNKHYHVVAIDLRGYGETDRPPRRSDYTLDKLTEDIVQLIPALGYSRCVLVGHDWGGAIAWSVAHRHPEVVEKLIVLNCPHTSIMVQTLASTWAQFMKSWYILMFQIPLLPEFIFRMRDYHYFNMIFRSRKAGVQNRDNFTMETVEAWKYVFSRPGALTPPLNYIRCVFNIGKGTRRASGPVTTPTLLVWGDKDAFLESCLPERHRDLVTDLRIEHLPNSSHWVQQDEPLKVNEFMKDFLQVQ